jgi:hypothetical protein
MLDKFALSSVALSIGEFLGTSELATCERAQLFSPAIFEWLWDVAGSKMLGDTPFWDIAAYQFLECSHGKDVISQIQSLKRNLIVPQEHLRRQWIAKTSCCSVNITPASCALHPSELHEPQNEPQSETVVEVHLAKPRRLCLAVTVGTKLGQPLVIGMKFAAAGPVNDNLCIGIRAAGYQDGERRMMSISFSPFSGNCFIEHDDVTLQANALPSVEVSKGRAWMHVTENGDIRFLRQFGDGQLEDTGLFPLDWFPSWIQTYFGYIDVWLGDLAADVVVDVEHSGCAFPSGMPICNKHGIQSEIEYWSVFGFDWALSDAAAMQRHRQ